MRECKQVIEGLTERVRALKREVVSLREGADFSRSAANKSCLSLDQAQLQSKLSQVQAAHATLLKAVHQNDGFSELKQTLQDLSNIIVSKSNSNSNSKQLSCILNQLDQWKDVFVAGPVSGQTFLDGQQLALEVLVKLTEDGY